MWIDLPTNWPLLFGILYFKQLLSIASNYGQQLLLFNSYQKGGEKYRIRFREVVSIPQKIKKGKLVACPSFNLNVMTN